MNENITAFLKKNIKLAVLLAVGVVLIIAPSFAGTEKSGSDLEKNLKATLEMAEGVGEVDVMITCSSENTAEGAIIVAEGADNAAIRKMLHDSAVSVLNVPDYKVQVLTKKK